MSKFLFTVLVIVVILAAGCSDPHSGTQQPVTTQPLFVSSTNAGRLSSIEVEGCSIKAFLDGLQITLEAQAFKMDGEMRGTQTNLSGLAISIDGLIAGPYEVDLFTNEKKVGIVMMDVNMDGSCSRFSVTTLMIH